MPSLGFCDSTRNVCATLEAFRSQARRSGGLKGDHVRPSLQYNSLLQTVLARYSV